MKVIDLHIADTPVSGGPATISPSLPVINYGADFAKLADSAGLADVTYKNAPFDAPQTVRFAATPVANVYTGSPVDPSYQLPYKRGVSILCQCNVVATVTDDADPVYRVDLPITAHLVVKAPVSGLLTADNIRTVAERAMALLYDNGSVDSIRLTNLLKGAMLPAAL